MEIRANGTMPPPDADCPKSQDCEPEDASCESDGTILLGRTATVLVAVLYNKQKICHGGQILLLQRGGIKRRYSLEID